MEVINKPELTILQLGNSIKVVQIEGKAGMRMPHHYCTEEAVIVVKEGQAMLTMPGHSKLLCEGDTFIIPAKKEHTLKIQKDFKALAIMAVESKINFI
tara:strand:+ start:25647 stop:25940 length:294 start_codon:yes stop_codon:yes gene_type:complete